MQKKVGNALYVFDTTPFTITEDTNAEVIYVQNECLKGYLELNTELESKIKTFNQWVLCVNAPWADTGTSEPTKNYHLLTVPITNRLYIRGYDRKLPPGGADSAWFDSFNQYQIEAGMIGPEEHNKIYCNAGAVIFLVYDIDAFETISGGLEIINIDGYGQYYGVIMGDSDMTVDFSYTLKPTYRVNFSADSNVNDGYVEISDHEQYAGKNVYIRLNGGESPSTITVTSNDVELTYDQPNNEYYFTMPEHDVTIKAYWPPIEISINLGDTDLTYRSDKPYDPSETYYKHAYFIVKPGNGKTTNDYTFNKSDDTITVDTSYNLFTIAFINSGTVTFANA